MGWCIKYGISYLISYAVSYKSGTVSRRSVVLRVCSMRVLADGALQPTRAGEPDPGTVVYYCSVLVTVAVLSVRMPSLP
jgi:hypothetical protein